jgi:hypothetical protein
LPALLRINKESCWKGEASKAESPEGLFAVLSLRAYQRALREVRKASFLAENFVETSFLPVRSLRSIILQTAKHPGCGDFAGLWVGRQD